MMGTGAWCILRCSGASTLPLASALTEAGFDVWAPFGGVVERTEPHRTRKEVQRALIPSFVFAKAHQLAELLALSHSPMLNYRVWDSELRRMVAKGIPYFSVFRSGNHRLIPDSDLAALRRAERREKPKTIEHAFIVGEKVRTSDDDAWTGLVGTVTAVRGKMIAVRFPSWDLEPEFAAWLLRPAIDAARQHHVNDEQATSARAA